VRLLCWNQDGKFVSLLDLLNTPKAVLVALVLVIAVTVPLFFYVYQERLLAAQGDASPATQASPRTVPQRASTSAAPQLIMAPMHEQVIPDVLERTDATGNSATTEQDR
jgi:hypothetical protein